MLVAAARRGDVDGVVAALKAGEDPNQRQGGTLPMEEAVACGRHLQITKLLIGARAEVDFICGASCFSGAHKKKGKAMKMTGLMMVCDSVQSGAPGNVLEFTKLLLESKADVNRRDALGCTALHHAVLFAQSDNDSVQVVAALLEASADVNVASDGVTVFGPNMKRLTPLDIALLRPLRQDQVSERQESETERERTFD